MAVLVQGPKETDLRSNSDQFAYLISALERLDRRLDRAVAQAEARNNPTVAFEALRGLYVTHAEVTSLLEHSPGQPLYRNETHSDSSEDDEEDESRLKWLKRAYGLSSFELEVLVMSLATEIDLRYERVFAFLQNDVTRKRPTVDLALSLLCISAEDRLSSIRYFTSDSPLVRNLIITLVPDPHQVRPPLLANYLKPDDQILALLLGHDCQDARISAFCRLAQPAIGFDEIHIHGDVKRSLIALSQSACAEKRPLRFHLTGPGPSTRRSCAEALSKELGASLLVVDVERAVTQGVNFEDWTRLILREAWFRNAVVLFDSCDVLTDEARRLQWEALTQAVENDQGLTVFSGTRSWPGELVKRLELINVEISIPDVSLRGASWRSSLAQAGITVKADEIELLSDRFKLSHEQIDEAVTEAKLGALRDRAANSEDSFEVSIERLRRAARERSGHELATLARKIYPRYGWNDIVLPPDVIKQLHEVCDRVAWRRRVLDDWGFDAKLSAGKGVNALFAGPSGTGKTMAAEIIGRELALDIYKIDLSSIVSKYIGDTERNLDRVFRAAEGASVILFFDEADALFGKRSEVHDSHDRYANIEISFLLQKMEEYDGIAILATNLRQNLDESFLRRLAFTVHFPFPDNSHRLRIWEGVWPRLVPLADDLALEALSESFKLSGGNIRNIALAAAFLAAAESSNVEMRHIILATRREFQKLGKPLSRSDLGELASYIPEYA